MSDSARGMPLLSGPPPPTTVEETQCRNCCKDFNVLFQRAKRCHHCGYSYCASSTCAGHQALMPKPGGGGYEVQPVCSLCIEMLMITASGKGHLRSVPLNKLRNYVKAYDIPLAENTLEKDDLIDAIIAARDESGCLPLEKEAFFRQHSVPDHPGDRLRQRSHFLSPDSPAHPARAPPPIPSPAPSGPPPARPEAANGAPRPQQPPSSRTSWNPFVRNSRSTEPMRPQPPPPARNRTPAPSRPAAAAPPPSPAAAAPPPRPAAAASPPPPPPPPPPAPSRPPPSPRAARPSSQPAPTLDFLLRQPPGYLSGLSISILKAILLDNHVTARLLLEKSDLVAKVQTLLDNTRRDREREAAIQKQEEDDELVRQEEIMAEIRARKEGSGPEAGGPSKPKPLAPERAGLCVVCQDEESCIASIDCGHLAMCRSCADLVMRSTHECPLCRTRIVTESRLLRIYKT